MLLLGTKQAIYIIVIIYKAIEQVLKAFCYFYFRNVSIKSTFRNKYRI